METNVACLCQSCGKQIEFDASLFQAGEAIMCPHCGAETAVSIPKIPTPIMVVTTGNDIAGHVIKNYLGVARGIVVRSPNLEQQMFGGFKKIVGGNIESYAGVCEDARTEAFDRMVKHAKAMCADAVIAFRYDATEFAPGVTEVLAYGTAVKLAEPS